MIDHSRVSNNLTDGIHLFENTNVKVTSSKASHSGFDGVDDNQSLGILNHVTANANGGWGVYVDHPARSGASFYTIENSTANHNFQTGFQILPLLDAAGRRRSPATLPGFGAGKAPRNKGSTVSRRSADRR